MEKGESGLSKAYKWLFVENIPFLYEAARVAKQCNVELWLDSSMLLQTFGAKLVSHEKQRRIRYIA